MSQPLYLRVAEELRLRISRGTYPVGTPLPSEAQFCEEFGASRGTVRQALGTLRHEGMIGGGQGKQPVVRTPALGQPFETFMSFTAWARQLGRVPGQRTIEVARRGADAVTADVLGLDPGKPVVEVLRQRTMDGEPALLERSSFVEPVGRLLFDWDPDSGSIYAYLSRQGVDLRRARHTIDAVAADETDAELLDVPVGSPLLRERRCARDSHGTPLESADDRYRPDRVTFTIDNERPAPNGAGADFRILKETSS
ncbi:GntR family transcriptional regulator [Microlunatus parietis]|uniref:GntR family transcriptional regulator n=1 Tax=Microlunatus parietis TaxID=682979 RepID=A0A7Y9LC35_9ACTN|nr:GntR family transcriptional regulator [Microlunatus parietis]NYE74444.1 GntR family transcriptional regulator [Microlunatus parietis]